jgi:hypothetical protein
MNLLDKLQLFGGLESVTPAEVSAGIRKARSNLHVMNVRRLIRDMLSVLETSIGIVHVRIEVS